MKHPRRFFHNSIERRAALLAAFLTVLALSCAGILLYGKIHAPKAMLARIYLRGELLAAVDLSAVTEPRLMTVTLPEGGSNTIRIVPGAIAVIEADCPDRLCVQCGYTDSPLRPVICLPHGLLIQLEAETDAPRAPDAVSY